MDGIKWRYRDRWDCHQKGEQVNEDTSRNGDMPDVAEWSSARRALYALRLVRRGVPMSEASARASIGERSVEMMKGVLLRDPALEGPLERDEITLNAAAVQSGYRVKKPPVGNRYFGKGDKWAEVATPMQQYLNGWRSRDYEFTHLPPREAAARVRMIDELIEGLQKCQADLARRSVRAQTAIKTH